jgi:hypothetical protein
MGSTDFRSLAMPIVSCDSLAALADCGVSVANNSAHSAAAMLRERGIRRSFIELSHRDSALLSNERKRGLLDGDSLENQRMQDCHEFVLVIDDGWPISDSFCRPVHTVPFASLPRVPA